ncbi:hypothetical protein [Kitasatospora cineracea]|uniref:hypothetical protein n=1 Tax=Kitasatospora cineracea TaxID=88074 RepID=UPI00367FBF37
MENARVDLTGPREELYEPLMRAVCPSSQGEAAFRLVYQVEPLWEWLLARGLVTVESRERYDLLDVDLPGALTRLQEEGGVAGPEGRDDPVARSAGAVLAVAANLAGSLHCSLRNVLYELTGDHVRLVAEAMMYAAGYLDGSADPWGNEGPASGHEEEWGPNSVAREERLAEL